MNNNIIPLVHKTNLLMICFVHPIDVCAFDRLLWEFDTSLWVMKFTF